LDFMTGSLMLLILSLICFSSIVLTKNQSLLNSLLLAMAIGAISGISQILGHIIWEKKSPAFRLFEAFVTTPFFILLDLLFDLFDYKPSLRQEIERRKSKWIGAEHKRN